MDLENVRSILQSILVVISIWLIHIEYTAVGYGLLIFFAVMLFQSAFTGACPLDFALRTAGLKHRCSDKTPDIVSDN